MSCQTRRFIPACAGNSWLRLAFLRLLAVHPRVCGEQSVAQGCQIVRAGSSPRVRGTVEIKPDYASPARFIPACAGNSAAIGHDPRREPVHPRVCGEQVPAFTSPSTRAGSSPRVRGTVAKHIAKEDRSRFIPACAGNRG